MNWSRHHTLWLALLLLLAAAAIFYGGFLISWHIPPAQPQLPPLPPISAPERLLILAPHEDDETLGCGGLIQREVAKGAAVRVVYLTNGDHNQLAFLLYRKRPWLSPSVNRNMGEVRHREAIEAMAYLGVPEEQLVFLGFPDHDTLDIWKRHWGNAPPLRSVLTNTTRVPYRASPSYGKPYKGEEIVSAIEQQLKEFQPTYILITHPADSNPDHRAYYLFLQLALLDLAGSIPEPQVYTYPIHMGPWPRPHWYHPDEWLPLPKRLAGERADALVFELTPEEVQRKYHAICLYRSQMADAAYWLTSFARKNELYLKGRALSLDTDSRWSPSRDMHSSGETRDYEKDKETGHVRGVSYRNTLDGLLVKISLRRAIEKDLGVMVSAFGYRHDTPFAKMPKLQIEWIWKRLVVYDGGSLVRKAEVRVAESVMAVDMLIPWHLLGSPEYVFSDAKGLRGPITVSMARWELISLQPGRDSHHS